MMIFHGDEMGSSLIIIDDNWWTYGGFHNHGGNHLSLDGRNFMKKSNRNWMRTGGTPFSGNHYILQDQEMFDVFLLATPLIIWKNPITKSLHHRSVASACSPSCLAEWSQLSSKANSSPSRHCRSSPATWMKESLQPGHWGHEGLEKTGKHVELHGQRDV